MNSDLYPKNSCVYRTLASTELGLSLTPMNQVHWSLVFTTLRVVKRFLDQSRHTGAAFNKVEPEEMEETGGNIWL